MSWGPDDTLSPQLMHIDFNIVFSITPGSQGLRTASRLWRILCSTDADIALELGILYS